MYEFWPLFLPFAAASGWYAAKKGERKQKASSYLSRDYFVGLNFLINEEPDKAVDIFIKLLEVDSDTVETHLALGNLFRRRGEVSRAIRVHQNLIARPELDKQTRVQALLALAQDYLRAGVFDRAERLFLEVVETGEYVALSLRYLLDIYQEEKNWQQAIKTAERYEVLTGEKCTVALAHYYCELAVLARAQNNFELSRRYLKQAFDIDKKCVRASILQAEVESATGQYKVAIRSYKGVEQQDADFLSEIITPLIVCYMQLDSEEELIHYLQNCLSHTPRISIAMVITEYLHKTQGISEAAYFLVTYLRKHSSLRGLKRLVELNLMGDGKGQENLQILQDLIANVLKNKPIYRCIQCGLNGRVLHWQCPGCRHWSTVKPILGVEGE